MRKKLLNLVALLVLGVGMTLMSEKQAHAYADPGSSLLLLQTAGSVLTASALYFRRRIASFFKSDKGAEAKQDSSDIATDITTPNTAK